MKQFLRNFIVGFVVGGIGFAAWNTSAAQAATVVTTPIAHSVTF